MDSLNRSTFFDGLRVHPEPFEYLDERSVHDALTARPLGYLDYLDRCLTRIAAGEIAVTLPPKLVFPDAESDGDFRVMPCIVGVGPRARKTVKIIGTNVVQKTIHDQITVGKAFCLDASENHITHIIEACLLSSARTGACATLALKRLALSRRRVAVIGAGRVGCYAAFYASALPGVEEVSFADVRSERAEAAAGLASRSFESTAAFRTCEDVSRIDADVVILTTTAQDSVLRPADTRARLVISTGADTPHQHELAPEWGFAADVYVDTIDGLHVGDLRVWLQDGIVQRSQLVDLVGLYRDGPRPGTRPRVFISTGSALFDNLTISYILDAG